ncbi:hypothetical protein ACFL6S_37695 [Candidatus Poribacteria bacterium]
MKKIAFVIFLVLTCGLTSLTCYAGQFDAAVIPKGAFYLKIFPEIFVISARFNDSGKPENIPGLSQLSYIDNQFELYYGITDSLMAGVLLPVGYVRQSYNAKGTSSTTEVKNPWIVIKHQFWSEVVASASSLRIKLPITEIDALKEGLDMDDKQVDIYPVYYLDWMMSQATYIYTQIGYKYRVKNGSIKPSDELRLVVETGYAIVPGLVRMFTFSDYTRFFGGKIGDEKERFSAGYLYTIAAGVRFMMGRDFQVEILTHADPYGKNQFRGIGGHVGVKYAFGM